MGHNSQFNETGMKPILEKTPARRKSMSGELLQELVRKYPPLLTQRQYCEVTGKAESTAEQDRQ